MAVSADGMFMTVTTRTPGSLDPQSVFVHEKQPWEARAHADERERPGVWNV